MIAVGQSPFSTIPAHTERRFSSVVSLIEEMIPTVKKTIACWKESLTFIEDVLKSKSVLDPFSKELKHDFELLRDYNTSLKFNVTACEMVAEKSHSHIKMFVALDSLGEIQALACYSLRSKTDLVVCDLITAPSNIRWKTSIPSLLAPLNGGGTLLMHALFKVLQIEKKSRIYLVALVTAAPFYQKLGMRQVDVDSFEFILSDRGHQEKIQNAFIKVFGPLFEYSLTLDEKIGKTAS